MNPVSKGAGAVVCALGIALLSGSVQGQAFLDDSDREWRNISKPIPGKVIVSVSQSRDEADWFAMSGVNRVETRYGGGALSQLQSYGIRRAWKALHRGLDATYELTFDAVGREHEVINYLRSLPNVRYAQRDYTVQFLAEPNDLYYQPDSLAPNMHWVPDTMNVAVPPGGVGVGRICDPLFTCCPEDSLIYIPLSHTWICSTCLIIGICSISGPTRPGISKREAQT